MKERHITRIGKWKVGEAGRVVPHMMNCPFCGRFLNAPDLDKERLWYCSNERIEIQHEALGITLETDPVKIRAIMAKSFAEAL